MLYNKYSVGRILARININFVGPWRILLGTSSIMVDVTSIDEARDYIEKNFGPILQEKLKARGINRMESIWDNSNILLNGKNIRQFDNLVLKDGGKIDLLPKVAGG
jgi:molybdopterin converting factor small subunit